eukprot:COSAG05_NODE_2196_length_3411_cov_2.646739_2_plen_96_part_00
MIAIAIAAADDDPASGPWVSELREVELSNHFFLSYLLYDIWHIMLAYPKLGGLDMLAHHALFIGCALTCGVSRACLPACLPACHHHQMHHPPIHL